MVDDDYSVPLGDRGNNFDVGELQHGIQNFLVFV